MAEKTTIARPYAQAIFAIAQEQGNLQRWSDMLALAAAVAADSAMAALIDNPRIGRDQIVQVFMDVCGDGIDDMGRNSIRVLAENGRLEFLPEIAQLYEAERAAAERTVQAEVVSAIELSSTQLKSIGEGLKRRFGRDVSLSCRVDESLLGGAVIRAGDVVIDGSVASKLERMRQQLMH